MSAVTILQLIWDDWNISHIARHLVSVGEVEEVCQSEFVVRPSYKNRLMLIGLTESKRMLAIVIQKKDKDLYLVVTARSADKKERLIYWQEKGE